MPSPVEWIIKKRDGGRHTAREQSLIAGFSPHRHR
jgi:hypothetical protein